MNKFVMSEKYDIFRIVIFMEYELNKFGFSIHAPSEKGGYEMTPVICHKAVFENTNEPLVKAQSIIDCMLLNEIDYRHLAFGREMK